MPWKLNVFKFPKKLLGFLGHGFMNFNLYRPKWSIVPREGVYQLFLIERDTWLILDKLYFLVVYLIFWNLISAIVTSVFKCWIVISFLVISVIWCYWTIHYIGVSAAFGSVWNNWPANFGKFPIRNCYIIYCYHFNFLFVKCYWNSFSWIWMDPSGLSFNDPGPLILNPKPPPCKGGALRLSYGPNCVQNYQFWIW